MCIPHRRCFTDSTITGNITAYAQNSDAGSAPQNMVIPIKTSEATTISTSTEEMDGSDNSPAGFSQVTVKPFTSQGEGNLGPQQHRGGPRGISSRRPVTARSTTDPSSFASSGCFSTGTVHDHSTDTWHREAKPNVHIYMLQNVV